MPRAMISLSMLKLTGDRTFKPSFSSQGKHLIQDLPDQGALVEEVTTLMCVIDCYFVVFTRLNSYKSVFRAFYLFDAGGNILPVYPNHVNHFPVIDGWNHTGETAIVL